MYVLLSTNFLSVIVFIVLTCSYLCLAHILQRQFYNWIYLRIFLIWSTFLLFKYSNTLLVLKQKCFNLFCNFSCNVQVTSNVPLHYSLTNFNYIVLFFANLSILNLSAKFTSFPFGCLLFVPHLNTAPIGLCISLSPCSMLIVRYCTTCTMIM